MLEILSLTSALDKFRLEGVQDDIANIQYLWSMITKSVSQFEDYLNNGQVISEQLASQFYAQAFLEVRKHFCFLFVHALRDYVITVDARYFEFGHRFKNIFIDSKAISTELETVLQGLFFYFFKVVSQCSNILMMKKT